VPGIAAPDRVLNGRYRLAREVAQGAMATVWEARDRVLDRPVAIKILHAHLANDETLTRFRNEAVAAGCLTHPNIVATYDTGSEAGLDYIVMERVNGRSLREILDERGPLGATLAVDIAMQAADALGYAHGHGVVHRDVKPENILVRADGCVKVTDFALTSADAPGDAHADPRVDIDALRRVFRAMLPADSTLPGVVAGATSATDFAAALRGTGLDGGDHTPMAGTPVVEPALAVPVSMRRRSRPAIVAVLLVGIAAGVAALLFSARTRVPLLGSQPAPAASTLTVTGASDFDPYGDRREHPEATARAIDGNPGTAWDTQIYRSNDFGGIKPGVGLRLDLGHAASVRRIEFDTPPGTWTGEIYAGDRPADELAGWGSPVASIHATGPHTTVTLDHPTTGRYLLVWVTRLPGTRFSLDEVRVAG
jgi:tRNA A-37 threonylcarbamoyl transferase component Bud32